MKRQYRFLKGFIAGVLVTSIFAIGGAALALIFMPEELAYRSQQTQQFKITAAPPPAKRVALAPYVEGWKDGVPFDDNTVPEPGTLLLIAGGVAALILTRRRK